MRGTKADAARALAAFSVEVQTGQKRPASPGVALTVNELVVWYLGFAGEERGLEHSTLVGYVEVSTCGSVTRLATPAPSACRQPTLTGPSAGCDARGFRGAG